MNGRTSVGLLSIALTFGCAGCITTQNEKNNSSNLPSPPAANPSKAEEVLRTAKKEEGPKRKPQAATEIASGRLMEAEADADNAKANPERQAQLRDRARKAYQAAITIDPNNLEAYRCLAGIYTKTNDFERALETYKKAMAKYPQNAGLWYDLGLCQQRRKDFPESVRCLTKALELEPENRDFMKKLGFTLAYMGQLEQGLAWLTRAQGAALANYNIARVLVQRDQVDQARQYLTLALRENAQLAEARELLQFIENPTPQTTPRGASE